jgi:hypothetical protein
MRALPLVGASARLKCVVVLAALTSPSYHLIYSIGI